jgi:hypothetical protein
MSFKRNFYYNYVARDVARGNTNALQVVEVVKMEMNRTTLFANLLAGKISVKFLNFRILERVFMMIIALARI